MGQKTPPSPAITLHATGVLHIAFAASMSRGQQAGPVSLLQYRTPNARPGRCRPWMTGFGFTVLPVEEIFLTA